MKRLVSILLCISVAISLCACGADNTAKETDPPKTYTVVIDIDCESNLLLNRYDVAVKVDSEKIGISATAGMSGFVLVGWPQALVATEIFCGYAIP